MAKKRRNKSPSRERYDKSHPVISERVSREFYDEFKLYLEITGQSAADVLKWAMNKQKAAVDAKVEELAGKRDNLRRTLLNLEKLIEQRKKELETPIEEERDRLQKELDTWYEREREGYEQAWSDNEALLEELRQKVEQQESHLGQLNREIATLEAKSKTMQAQNDRFSKEMEMCMWVINTCPGLFCQQCPGAWFNQMILNMIKELSSVIGNKPPKEA